MPEEGEDGIILPVSDSTPRVYFKGVSITTKKSGWATILLSDLQTTELHVKDGQIYKTGDRLNPVVEILTDVGQLAILRDTIIKRLEKHNEMYGESDG